MLYRVAIQTITVPPIWQWKSTPLSSLDAVLRFLRQYRAIRQDRLRVFSSASRQDLDEQFKLEQEAMGTYSVTAEQFLCERRISSGGATGGTSEQKTQHNQMAVSGGAILSRSANGNSKRTATLDSMDRLDYKRVELEQGAGGDHDLPYHFAFPPTWQQACSWTELLVQVQRGQLQS
jgi:hypothetical protein